MPSCPAGQFFRLVHLRVTGSEVIVNGRTVIRHSPEATVLVTSTGVSSPPVWSLLAALISGVLIGAGLACLLVLVSSPAIAALAPAHVESRLSEWDADEAWQAPRCGAARLGLGRVRFGRYEARRTQKIA
jgi:hypothetical protein